MSKLEEANNIGQAGFVLSATEDCEYLESTIFTLTFAAKKAGDVTLTLKEDSAGTGGFKGTAATKTVTIAGASEPECEHKETKAVSNNNNGTHNVVCANAECGEIITKDVACTDTNNDLKCDAGCGYEFPKPECKHENTKVVPNNDGTHKIVCTNTECGATVDTVDCSGGTATCTAQAQCSECGAEYGNFGAHAYGELIPAQEAVHTQTELKAAVAAHFYCAECETYFDADKNETTLDALTGETPEHTVDENKTTTTTQKPTCTEEGTEVVATFCSCGKALGTTTNDIEPNPNAHTWGEPTYGWNSDRSAYLATVVCEENAEHKETAEAEVTYKQIENETCGADGQREYTATFDVSWAETQEWTEDLPGATGNHKFDNDCDTVCNVCKATREVPDHVSDAAPCEDGKCVNCGIDMPATEEHKGEYTFYIEEDDDTEGYLVAFIIRHCTLCNNVFSTSVSTGGEVTTVADCQTKGVTTFTFDFTRFDDIAWDNFQLKENSLGENMTWNAETKVLTYTVVGETDPNNHPAEQIHAIKYDYNGNGTHDIYNMCVVCSTVLNCVDADVSCFDNYVNADYEEGADGLCDACNAKMRVTITIHYPALEPNDAKTLTDTQPYGTTVALSGAPAATGYNFVGYATDAEGKNMVAIADNHCEYTFTEDGVTLYAIYEVATYTLTVYDMDTAKHTFSVAYGTNILEFLSKQDVDTESKTWNDDTYKIGINFFVGWVVPEPWGEVSEDTVLTGDLSIEARITFDGWYSDDEGKTWRFGTKDSYGYLCGWNFIEEDYDGVEGGAWYYFNEETYERAEGLTRAPYPTEAIEGITYGPNAEDMAYDNYIDATEAWFLFGEDGKFQNTTTGFYADNGTTRWVENGQIVWHVGMVKVDGKYYYIAGDATNGGNILATQVEGNENGTIDIWVSRANHSSLDRDFNPGYYTFSRNIGAMKTLYGLCFYGGTERIRYYGMNDADENRLMCGAGLVDFSGNYIYVRSNGELVVNAEYWVPANELGIVPGMYSFDENGKMIQPEMTDKNGIVAENGVLFFYENGKLAYNKGLIEFEGHVIYVRSNGQLAVGEYYVTNLDNYTGTDVKSGDKVSFDENGFMQAPKNGVIDGKYYVNGKLAYNAGVVEIEEGKYIYVRSNGEVVMGKSYWITNVGESGIVAKQYTFDDSGIMQNPEFTAQVKNGIVDGYYYVDGKLAYAAGVIKLEDGAYIYVRSNGQLATGSYWATNTNGELDAKLYNWGEDGKLYI